MPGAVADARPSSGSRLDGHPIAGIRYLDGDRRAEATFRHGPGRGVRRTALHAALRDRRRPAPASRPSRGRCASVDDRGDHLLVDGEPDPLPRRRRRAALAGAPAARPRRAGRGPAAATGCAATCRVAPWTPCVEVHWAAVGEAYVTPVGDGLVGHRGAQRPSAGRSPTLLAEFPALASALAGQPVEQVRGAGPLRQRSRRRVAGRVLLVGDAAGYVDALTGEGIALGLAQARAAVAAVRAATPQGYERALAPARPAPRPAHPRPARRHPAPGAASPDRAGGRTAAAGVRRGRQPAREAGMSADAVEELVVLLDEAGRAIGTDAQGRRCTTRDTPLHLAFSCYLFDADGPAAPHPARPAQADLAGRVDQQRAAATRRPASRSRTPYAGGCAQELGLRVERRCALVLPAFRYRAVMPDGVVENEMCPVFVATTTRTRWRPTRPRWTTHAG